MLWIPLTLHLQEMTDSGLAVAALFIALWAPVVLLAPIAGVVVDRFESRGVLLVAAISQAVVAAALAFSLDSEAMILGLAALLGVGFAFAQPAEFALVPVIAGERELTQVNGWVESSRYAGTTAGPALGGIVAAAGGTDVALLINAATFAALALAAWLLRARRPAAVHDPEAPPPRARDGVVLLFRERTLAVVMAALFVSLLFMTASATAEVFFLKEDLEVGDAVYGLVFSAWTAGMVLGALVIARRVPRSALALGALVAIAIQGIGLGMPTAWLVVWFGAAMWMVGGLAHGTKNVLARTLIQERVPAAAHGRAFAAYNGLRNGAELVALALGGVLVAALGGRVTLALAGAIPAAAAVIAISLYLRRRDPEPAAPEPAVAA